MPHTLNMFVPLACPHCHADLLARLSDIEDETTIQCNRCGAGVELGPDVLGPIALFPSAPQYDSFWLES